MSSKKYVCNQAKIECQMCANPVGTLMVTSNMIKLQGKQWATAKDKEKTNLLFQGTCMKSPQQSLPCIAVIQPGEWQGTGDALIQGENALLETSTIMCNYGGAMIKISDHLQMAQPSALLPTAIDGITPDIPISKTIASSKLESTRTTQTLRIRPAIEETADEIVEPTVMSIGAIECITELDLGSDNLGQGETKGGFVYGNAYKFKVTAYGEGFIPNEDEKQQIIWEYTFINDEGTEKTVTSENESGETFTLKIEDTEMLGKAVSIYAYYCDKDLEASFDGFCHNRFRYFDQSIVEAQVKSRMQSPWKIDQGYSSLCGMAALYYVLAKKDPMGYEKLAKELHQKGESNYNGYALKPHEDALEMYDMNPKSADYKTVNMPLVDWITLATTRSKESSLYKMVYRGIEYGSMDQIRGVNWPRMMERLCRELVGYTNVEETGLNELLLQQKKRPLGGRIYDYFSDGDLEHLQKMDKEHKWGRQILMMVDADIIEGEVSYSYGDIFNDSHWVVYEGGLRLLDSDKEITTNLEKVEYVSFNVYTWGYDPVSLVDENKNPADPSYKLLISRVISAKSFKSNFYGYIKLA